jgi:hypothetical protein
MHARSGTGLVLFAVAIGLAATLVARPLASQEPPVFTTEVNVVAVTVFVTDKSGRAVAGLTAADFELEDQGKKVPLVAFLPVDASGAAPGGEAGPLMQASARRQLLFLFDLTFSTPTRRPGRSRTTRRGIAGGRALDSPLSRPPPPEDARQPEASPPGDPGDPGDS